MNKKTTLSTPKQLVAENAELRARLEEAEETLRAIRSGEVDALVVPGVGGDQLYTLKGADRTYRVLIEEMNEGALTLTAEGVILYANHSFAEMLKTPLENVIGSDIHAWIAPDSQPILQSLLRKGVDEKRREQLAVTASDGTLVQVSLSASNLLINEMPASFCLVATDLTEQKRGEAIVASETLARELLAASNQSRLVLLSVIEDQKQAEETLREKERLLSEAQRIGHIGSWSYDIEADAFIYSDEMYRLFDASNEELQHNRQGFLELIYSPDRPMVARWLEDIRIRGQTKEIEFLVFRKNSELRYIRCGGAVHFDKTGKPRRFTATAQDVTERKLAEIQIRQQLERLTALRKIDRAISSSFDLKVTLDILLSQVTSQLQVDAANILLLVPQERLLEYAAGKGFRTNAIESARLRMNDSQAGRAAVERRTIHIESLENKPDERLRTPPGSAEGFLCYFAVPLIVKRKVMGVLEVFHRAPLQPYPEWLEFLDALAGQAAIAIDNATLFENLERSNSELSQAYDATIEGWSRALDLRDKETEGHTLRVTEMTLKLARAFHMPEEEMLHIRRGGLLHDIGKMGVPDKILLKPGALTEEEWVRMRSHPQYAYDLLKPITFLARALDIPYCHHEKWDGTGYPRRLKGQEIPLVARLFAVVDVWDALRSDRPYRSAWTGERTLEHIRSLSGTHFDPKVVESFLNMIKEE